MVSKVYFYVPNLIGYTRIFLAFIAFGVATSNHILFFACYALSQFLDQWDGHFARALNQSTRFGAVLDMVTDRCSTASLVVVLSHFYPNWTNLFIFIISLDITSHYSRLYSTLTTGKSSHKDVDPDNNRLLYIYYSNRYFLYTMCFGNEATFLFLYLSHFWTGPVLFTLPLGDWFNIPPFFSTTVTLVSLLFMIALPISLLKQYINVLQLVQACSDIVELDERYPVNGKKQMVQRARATSPARSPKGSSPRKNK